MPAGLRASSAIFILYFLAPPVYLGASGLRAGAAKSIITPDVRAGKVYMAGFNHNRIATGVHDDLYARCLALGVANKTLVLCSVDLIGFFYDDVLKVREKAKILAPELTHVIVASTHDHEGPDAMGLWGPTDLQSGMDEKYMDWLDERIAQTAAQAVHNMVASRLTLARDDHPLLAMLQSDSRPPYVKDPYLFVMRLASLAKDEPIATLVNWSDHPETLDSKNTEITADYPHWLCEYLEGHLGGTAVFFNGSIGGLLSSLGDEVALQDPASGEIAKDGTWKKAELFGSTVGALALRALKSGEDVQVDSLRIRKSVIFPRMKNDGFRAAGALGIFRNRKPMYTGGKLDTSVAEKELPGYGMLKYLTGEDTKTEINYIQLLSRGRAVAEITTIPGEIYPELINGGIARYPGADFPDAPFEPTLRQHLRSKYQFVFGLANDEIGYIIPKAEWDDQPPWLQNKKDRWYGEINSAGPEVSGVVMRTLVTLIDQN